MAVGRSDVHAARPDSVGLPCLDDVKWSPAAEDVRHEASMPGIEVLDHDDRRAKIRRQAGQDLSKGSQPTGRSGHRHDVEGASHRLPWQASNLIRLWFEAAVRLLHGLVPPSGPCYSRIPFAAILTN